MATKKDLIKAVSEKLNLSNIDALSCIDLTLEYIKDELNKGNRVEIRGLGSFSVRRKKYANQDKEYNTIYFRMSKNIEDRLK